MPTEHLANFSAEQPQFATTSDLPTATTSGDEAVLDKIKEYLMNENEVKKLNATAAPNQNSQPMQQGDQSSAQYGFVSQSYKKDGEQADSHEDYKQQVYEDLASPPPAVRFEQYMPINKRIIKTTRTKR